MRVRATQQENFYAFLRFAFDVLHSGTEFRRSDFLVAMCFALECVAKGERTRQIITVPARHLKSITAAVALPAFIMGRDPLKKIIVASYGSDLAARHARDFRLVTKNLCVWAKKSGGMGSFYRSQHEMVFVYKSGTAPHINTFGLGETGRYRTNVWSYNGANSFGNGRMADLAAHPTVKPTALVADAIRDTSRRGEIVLDPFCGSGTTIMAAERTGRRARCIELEPGYVDTAIRRWEAFTGKRAVHIETGLTMAALAEQRNTDQPRVDQRECAL